MSYRTIILGLTDIAHAEGLTTAACALARKFDAHLVGVHVLQSLDLNSGIGMEFPAQAVATFAEEKQHQADRIRAVFERLTAGEDFTSEWRLPKADGMSVEDRLIEHAHGGDLIVMSQADRDRYEMAQSRLLQDVIKRSGLPVLVIPYAGQYETFGDHALIGWSATRESSRAAHDAIPFMQSGRKATLIWVSQGTENTGHLESTAHQMVNCLERHGIDAETTHWQNSRIAIADALLNEASDRGADLIVTGAFGHSKFYDFVIGATTSALMDRMTVPVLFSK